jgi:teichuronic acid biosynthesis glycosyltransferase TuaC
MRVLMLSHLFPRPAEPGAVPFIRRQVEELMSRGVEFRVLSPVPWAPRVPGWTPRLRQALSASRAAPAEWYIGEIRVTAPRYLKLPGALDAGLFGPLYYLGVRGLVHRIYREEGFDLIHGQMLLPDGYAAARLGRELRVPSVATERGYVSRLPARGPRRGMTANAVRGLDQVVTVSNAIAAQARTLAAPKRPIRTVYTGVAGDLFQPRDRHQARARLGLSDGPLVVCVARLEPIKQPTLLVRAFRRVVDALPEAVLVWVGDGSQRQEVATLARDLGLQGRLLLAGQAPQPDVVDWIAAANVVALVSRSEGLPNSLVEASACGRPVVATLVGGVPEVVLDGETGILVSPADDGPLSKAILELLTNPELAAKMGDSARRYAMKKFSWQRHADEMVDVYRTVTGGYKAGT